MADQLRWFKVWTSAARDADLRALPLDDFARWVLFGLYVREHGDTGRVVLRYPCRALLDMLRVPPRAPLRVRWTRFVATLRKFPNVLVDGDGDTVTVTVRNWAKYQEDTSWKRMREYRDRRNAGRNGDRNDVRNTSDVQTRRDETEPPIVPPLSGAEQHPAPHSTPPYGWSTLPPPGSVRDDCRDATWRGRCVDAAWATLHPEAYPLSRSGEPLRCNHHRALDPWKARA